jgi:phenylalanyl-tRNA synthetase beta chain
VKLSLNWLKDFVALPESLSPSEISRRLTISTVEVESFEVLTEKFNNIVVGKILEISTHPKADRLRLVNVDLGEENPQQVVCGASNLSIGMLVAFAKLGAKVKWHGEGELIELKEAEIRGVKSAGMICASEEIGIGELFPASSEKEIVDFSNFNFKPGTKIADALGLDDVIFEIDNKSLTNRPDLWGHLGMARELSAIFECPFHDPNLPDICDILGKKSELKAKINASELCGRYIGVHIDNVVVKQSPINIKTRLASIGQRPINLIVDLTNYVMFSIGQPLHAFDARKIANFEIEVRTAHQGEKLTLLDETVLNLSPNNLVIADSNKSLALAGIMGGKDSSIADDVKSLVLESANFKAVPIRRTASGFKLRTESSMRFEKGIDTERAALGMRLLVAMLLENYPEAEVLGGVDVYPSKPKDIEITVNIEFITSRIGKELSSAQIKELLVRLGYVVKVNKNVFTVGVPSWRATGDVSIPEDIVEEVARLYGYDNIEFVPLNVKLVSSIKRNRYNLERSIKEYLAYQAGASEIFSYPWCEEALLEAASVQFNRCLTLADAPSPSQRHLHPTLVAQLLGACRGNLRFSEEFSLFEMARVFSNEKVSEFSLGKEKLPYQPKKIACAVVGLNAKEVFFKAKGILSGLFAGTFIKQPQLHVDGSYSGWVARGSGLGIFLEEQQIGELGLVSSKSKLLADISRGELAIFELNVDALEPLATIEHNYTPLPKYPQTECDFSFLFDENTTWKSIERESQNAHHYVTSVKFIEEYRGEQIPVGKKSLAFRVTLANPEGSLTSEQIQTSSNEIINKLTARCGGELRSN